ncbi:MAG TPA: T6SS immunity protein Tdi1 domain-containing protein [Kofleriaceae bacterium]|jgi:hypothetical protein
MATKKPAKKKPVVKKSNPKKPAAKKAPAKKAPAKKAAAKRAPAKKSAAKKSAAKRAPAKKAPAKKAPAKKANARPTSFALESHPAYIALTSKLTPGRHADGALLVTEPGADDDVMAPWLMGNVDGRRSLGRTAFGDIVIFRDLRARAHELGMADADKACDISMVDIHYKRMAMLASDPEQFISSLDDREWQDAFLRGELYRTAKDRIGDYTDDECFYFVPALALGGSDSADSVDRGNWRVHQSILLQT